MNLNKNTFRLTILFAFFAIVFSACTSAQIIDEVIEVPDRNIPTIGIIKEDELNKIESASQLRELIAKEIDFSQGQYRDSFQTIKSGALTKGFAVAEAAVDSSLDFTGTNNQVEGIDEADIVKTNGEIIFTKTNNDITLVSVEDKEIISKIKAGEKENLQSFFITDNQIIIIYNTYKELPRVSSESLQMYTSYDDQTIIKYYDISNVEEPELKEEFEMSGRYYQARMMNGHFYLITNEYLRYSDDIPMPVVYKGGVKIAQPEVFYFSIRPSSQFYTITSMNLEDPNNFVSESYLLDSGATVYVSENAIYMGYQKRITIDPIDRFAKTTYPLIKDSQKEIFDKHIQREDKQAIAVTLEEYLTTLDEEAKKEFNKELNKRMQEYQEKINAEHRKTVIQKITVDGTKIFYHGSGEVEGRLLNQFSLDENNGNLRIATQTSFWVLGEGSKRYTNVFVLDEDLEILGSIEKLAEDETMYSSRFLGDRLYLVTFEQIDPLFVIDLSEPKQPRVEGKLKIPGFSTYLHPYGDTYLIGVGKETEQKEDGRVVTTGVKVSLFDINDMRDPKEADKVVIGDQWTSTPIAYEHKAFLFDPKSRILAIPVQKGITNDDSKYYPRTNEYYNEIFRIDETGFTKLGEIHHKNSEEYWSSPDKNYKVHYY